MTARLVDAGRRHADAVAAAGLAVLAALIVGPGWLPGRVLSPGENLFTTFPWEAVAPGPIVPQPATADVTSLVHPMLVHAAREVQAGRLPFWNPFQYAGAPFLSNPNAAVLSPLTALAYVLPLGVAVALGAWLKLAGAGLGLYAFLRGLGVAPLPAVIGAVGFMASSSMVGWLLWTQAATIALIPWVLLAVDRVRAGGRRGVAALALVVGLDVLAGYPQTTFHTLVLAAAWALARSPGPGAVAFLARAAAGGALGVALAAVQILPFLDYARESAIYAYRSQWTFPLHSPAATLVTFLMPEFFGRGAEFWGPWQFVITATYAGLVPLVGLPLALAGAWRRPGTRFFAVTALVVAGIHYGAPGLGTLALLPGMALGNNLRLMPFLVLAVSVLGALGLDAAARGACGASPWPGRLARGWFVVLAAAGLLAVAAHADEPGAAAVVYTPPAQYLVCLAMLTVGTLALVAWLDEPAAGARWGWALLGLQLASVLPLAVTYNGAVDRRWFYPTPPSIAWLQGRSADHARALVPNSTGAVYRLREAHGYDGMTPRRIEALVGSVGTGLPLVHGLRQNAVVLHGSEPLAAIAVLTSPALDLLAVRWVVAPPRAAPPRADLLLAYDRADARVYMNPRALPRAFVVGRARCADDATALRAAREGGTDFRARVLLSDCAPTEPAEAGTADGGGIAEIVEDGTNRVRVAVDASAPAYLVLLDTWFPGWRATLGGREVPVRRADYAFRAVAVPAGRSEVAFVFRPRGFDAGLAVSALAAVLIAALLGYGRRRADG